ncbi:hypothetical protein Ocin01_09806 [Orchesella cincta]|uniref:Uncharacterized protein n=1 Tax=Orchesella cincta TaxID=48709 RepID=A0A1D2MVB0_ORCCI|nr:hypothetical protein Ocin01_09806 [Orchesella cincta]
MVAPLLISDFDEENAQGRCKNREDTNSRVPDSNHWMLLNRGMENPVLELEPSIWQPKLILR